MLNIQGHFEVDNMCWSSRFQPHALGVVCSVINNQKMATCGCSSMRKAFAAMCQRRASAAARRLCILGVQRAMSHQQRLIHAECVDASCQARSAELAPRANAQHGLQHSRVCATGRAR